MFFFAFSSISISILSIVTTTGQRNWTSWERAKVGDDKKAGGFDGNEYHKDLQYRSRTFEKKWFEWNGRQQKEWQA